MMLTAVAIKGLTTIFQNKEGQQYSFDYISIFDGKPALYCTKGFTVDKEKLILYGQLTVIGGEKQS